MKEEMRISHCVSLEEGRGMVRYAGAKCVGFCFSGEDALACLRVPRRAALVGVVVGWRGVPVSGVRPAVAAWVRSAPWPCGPLAGSVVSPVALEG